MFIEDLSPHPVCGKKSIGYLEGDHAKGKVPKGFVKRLKRICEKISSNPGNHLCPYCSNAKSSSEIQAGEYVWPEMLVHYIRCHEYLPPKEFVEFIMNYDFDRVEQEERTRIDLPDFDDLW